jgi:hypothetical protein
LEPPVSNAPRPRLWKGLWTAVWISVPENGCVLLDFPVHLARKRR